MRIRRGQYPSELGRSGGAQLRRCKGETRLASGPAVIVEISYINTFTPGNEALHDETFKRLVAQAIRSAIKTGVQ